MVRQKSGRAKSNKKDLFIVEAFIDRRRRPDGILELLVKWKDYPSSHNTWEESRNVAHCSDIVNEFREQRLAEGFDDSEYEADFIPANPPIIVAKSPPKKRRRATAKKNQPDDPQPSSSANTSTMAEVAQNYDTSFISSNGATDTSLLSSWSLSDAVEPTFENFEADESVDVIVSAVKILSTTVFDGVRHFAVLLSNGDRVWFNNPYVRQSWPQLLLDYYEKCVAGDVTRPAETVAGPVGNYESVPSSSVQKPVQNQWSTAPSVPTPSRDASVPPATPQNSSYLNLINQQFAPPPPPQQQMIPNSMPVNFYPHQYQHQPHQQPLYQQPMPLDYSRHQHRPQQLHQPLQLHQAPLQSPQQHQMPLQSPQQHQMPLQSPQQHQMPLQSPHQHHLPPPPQQHHQLPPPPIPQQQHYQPPPQPQPEPVNPDPLYGGYGQNFDNNEIDWFVHEDSLS